MNIHKFFKEKDKHGTKHISFGMYEDNAKSLYDYAESQNMEYSDYYSRILFQHIKKEKLQEEKTIEEIELNKIAEDYIEKRSILKEDLQTIIIPVVDTLITDIDNLSTRNNIEPNKLIMKICIVDMLKKGILTIKQ